MTKFVLIFLSTKMKNFARHQKETGVLSGAGISAESPG
jgi:hypothetical protein